MASNNEGVAAVAWWTVIAVALFFMFGTDACKNKIWYSLTTAATYDQVNVEKKPTDCDWGRAPLGDKGCEYKKDVQVTRRRDW